MGRGSRRTARFGGSIRVASIGALVAAAACRPSRAKGDERQPIDAPPIAVPLAEAPGGGMIVEKNAMVPIRDGVRLATDVYRPSGPGRYPVVLVRTPYGSETVEFGKQARFYVERGYAFAVQDCRGRYDSEGDWYGKRDEGKDGSDAITWLGTRAWSSGKVGMTGGSYLGNVQYLVSDQENPYLAALVPMAAPTTLGRDTTEYDRITGFAGRESAASFLGWMLMMDGRVNQADGQGDFLGLTFRTGREHLPLIEYPRVFGRPMSWWPALLHQRHGLNEEYYRRAALGQWTGPAPDPAWWGSYRDRYQKVRVPMLHISGWFDCCGEQPIRMFQLIRELAALPAARENQRLILGPWTHAVGQRKNGDLDFGPLAAMNPDSLSVWWFDHWLKGIRNGVDSQPPVRVFVMGENRWRDANDWPLPGTRFTKFYLHSAGNARLETGGGTVSTEPPEQEPPDRYTYDPGDPTPGSVNPDSFPVMLGSVNLTRIERRPDVLVYTSDVLTTPTEITGPVSAVIYLATSAPSTDLLVRLIDVYPDRTPYNVFLGYASPYRTHWAKEVERNADSTTIIKADIVLPPTGIVFQAGHRLRIELSSAAAPLFRGLNVAPDSEPYVRQWIIARQTIYHDAAHPSHLLLPVIPR